ncbi:MAG: hypothetical protein QXO76_02640 [Thermoproteota archaeon]
MLNSCKKLARYAEQVGAVFCIETGQERAEILRRLLEDVGSEGLKVNYDPANMLKYGVVEGVESWPHGSCIPMLRTITPLQDVQQSAKA